MRNKIQKTILDIQSFWKNPSMDSIDKIKSTLKFLAADQDFQSHLQIETRNLPKGLELYNDREDGFILLAYFEGQNTYRIPHDHGRAWVIYVVASGEVEMGSYMNASKPDGSEHLILKNREKLLAGDTRIYYPGEIHDTRCVSENALILRLTSLDLKEEERTGRMKRYQNGGAAR